MKTLFLLAVMITIVSTSAASADTEAKAQPIVKEPFGTVDGTSVFLYTLRNNAGMEVKITNYGGIVVSLSVPDKQGTAGDIVLGYDSVQEYVKDSPYFGCLVGRYGNRIARGKFTLDGKTYTLATNNGANHLHGGRKGFDKVVWSARESTRSAEPTLYLTYTSRDGEEGYPGALTAEVAYSVTEKNELRIVYRATTDKPTVVNLTHHSYFNLAGAGTGDVLEHQMMINADRFTPIDEGLIPTGELRPVEGTPMDFRTPAAIGGRIGADDEQMRFGGGYDHNFVLNREAGRKDGAELQLAARVTEPTSGRTMEVWTTEPGIQFYSGNFLDGKNTGKGGKRYKHRYGFCLETQHFPDSPNHPAFPNTVLRPGEQYSTTTVYRFGIGK